MPNEKILSPVKAQKLGSMEWSWQTACQRPGSKLENAQKRQKATYNRGSRLLNFAVGEWVFLLNPSEKTGEARKLARPFHGPYSIMEVSPSNAYIQCVDRPQDDTIFVSLQHLRRCSDEIPNEFWKRESPEFRARTPEVKE